MEALPETNASAEELTRQIEELKKKLEIVQANKQVAGPSTPSKRKQEGTMVIAVNTPSPKKRKLDNLYVLQPITSQNKAALVSKPNRPVLPEAPPPKPSNLLQNLARIHMKSTTATVEPVERSTGFTDAAVPSQEPARKSSAPERDNRLALVERLEPGPLEHKPPVDDPEFQLLEPYSGIRLTSRRLSHDLLQEHFTGRYYLSPSLLYSVIRPLPSNQGYDVPVAGDWITIAVIAKRGEIMFTNNTTVKDEDFSVGKDKGKGKEKEKPEERKKRYMSLKLVDFGTRGTGPKSKIRGDALLSMLLFEADSCSYADDGSTGSKGERLNIYKGGSGGAFEACMKLHEGAVIAILNPKIMKPFKRDMSTPHPTKNILAITPTSAQSIAIVGQSRDLGMCAAVRRDGKVCGDWCDKRIAEYCEFHIETAVKRNRAGRAEFTAGTSGMSTSNKARKPAFDPDRKWGLLPDESKVGGGSGSGEGTTYVISGHVISSSRPEYVEEKIGRGRAERLKRRREEEETEKMLNTVLGRDGDGVNPNSAAGAVRKAREVMKMLKGEKADKKGSSSDSAKEAGPAKKGYSAEAIKRIGFDPMAKSGRDEKTADTQRKLELLESLQKRPGEINLGPRPGPKIRSGIRLPTPQSKAITEKQQDSNSDSELEIELGPKLFGPGNRVSESHSKTIPEKQQEDDSDSDLEIELRPKILRTQVPAASHSNTILEKQQECGSDSDLEIEP
ncbi:hypothetical protein M422DRAFT_45867 [Sphaerobolus stellatus SS14]|nr:hypothetical protein M422DRAFT_45867 [Sphaerobolus stellatus SS14]